MLKKIEKLNTVQKILCLLVVALLIGGEGIVSAMGVDYHQEDNVLIASIVVSLMGIYFFKDKREE